MRTRRTPFALALALVLAASAALAAPAEAAHIGPDNFGYVSEDATFSFVDITSTGTGVLSGSDDGTTTQNIGFTFDFYGQSYTQVTWSANGMLSFGGTESAASNPNISINNTAANLPTIAVYWDDLTFSGGDQTYYETVGSSGSQQFIITWNQALHKTGASSDVTFQVILFEGSDMILFQYDDLDFNDSNLDFGKSATVGIRDVNGHTNGRNLTWLFNAADLSNDQALVFFVIPEPGTVALFGLGAGGLAAAAAARRRRRRRAGRRAA